MDYIESSTITIINKLEVSYTDEGPLAAPVIIFIHGFPLNKSMWDAQLESLRDEYRVIAYDVRGHGESEAGNDHFTIDLFASDLLNLMRKLNIKKATLCGLSMGGYIALNAVINFPEYFEALILSDTSCSADTPKARNKRLEAIESIRKTGIENFADASLKNLFASGSFKNKQEEINSVREMIVNTSDKSVFNTLHALAIRKATFNRLSEINIPVLILVGDEDKITSPIAAMVMHQHIRGSVLSIIGNAAHMSNMENPQEFNHRLKTFVEMVF